MRKIFTFLVFTLILFCYKSQQVTLNSQYLFNDFTINPAVAGTKAYSPLSFSFRRQWMGIDEAPISQNFMYHTYLGDKVGLGGHIFNDVAGPSEDLDLVQLSLIILKQVNALNFHLEFLVH